MTSTIINRDNLADKFCSLFRDLLKDTEYPFPPRPIKKVIRETAFIDILQSLVDYGNSRILKSFKIRLEMEEYADSDNFARMEESRA